MYYSLGKGVTFCYQKREIKINSKVIQLGGRESNMLLLFLENSNVLLSKELINKRVWGDVLVAETSLTKAISNIRKVFSNNPEIDCELKTFSKQGYMLVIERDPGEACNVIVSPEKEKMESNLKEEVILRANDAHGNLRATSFWSSTTLQVILIALSTSIITDLIALKLHVF